MTQQGHFVVNGSPRICITQVVRGPGVYVRRRIENGRKRISYVDFVPERGGWVRIEKDREKLFWIHIRKEPRLPFWLVLQLLFVRFFSFHFYFLLIKKEEKVTIQLFSYQVVLNRNFSGFSFILFEIDREIKDKDSFSSRNRVRIRILWGQFFYSIFSGFQRKKTKFTCSFRKFLSFQVYNLGEVGRQRVNERFRQGFSFSIHFLIPTDFFCAWSELDQ